MPSEEIQINFTGRSGESTMLQARAFYDIVREYSPNPENILDFGCGWGRITRCALGYHPPERIIGCDCMPEMVGLCEKMLPCEFVLNDPMPPSSFMDGSFNLIYAYSVFSHLSEVATNAWIAEFHRILAPGGMVVITTRGGDFIPILGKLKDFNRPSHDEIEVLKNRYAEGKFVHVPSDGGSNLSDNFYGETAIPKAYMKNWKGFRLIKFIDSPPPHIDQYIAVLERL